MLQKFRGVQASATTSLKQDGWAVADCYIDV